MEVFPALIAIPYLVWTHQHFRFTTLVYSLIAIHAVILIIGGHYTYAEVPLFNWIRDANGFDRNYYDRIGHLAQGFIPAMIAREVLLRRILLGKGPMLTFVVVSICMAISSFYEILEFGIAKAIGDSAENFLGTQGDVWDTQWDMTFCLIGATAALALLSKWHDQQLGHLPNAGVAGSP